MQFTVVAADPDGDPLLYNLVNPPPGAAFNALTGVFSWTPGYGQAGDHTLHFTVADPVGATRTLDVLLHVAHVVRPPVLNTPNHQATLGVPLVPDPGDRSRCRDHAHVLRDQPPLGAAINPQTGQFQWTPGPSQAGDYVVTLQVSDGQATSTQNILIVASVQPQLPS